VASAIIESLFVTLGLDASGYTREQAKANEAIQQTRKTVLSATESMGESLLGFAGKLSVFFLGFEGLRGVIDLVKTTATEFKNLGITAELLGTSVREVRTLGEFSQLAGAAPTAAADWASGMRERMASLVFGRVPQWALPTLIGLNPMQLAGMDPAQALKLVSQGTLSHGAQLQSMLAGLMPGISRQAAQGLFLQAYGLPAPLAAELISPHMKPDMARAERTNKSVTDLQAEAGRRAANAIIDLRYRVENVAGPAGFGLLTSAANLLGAAFTELTKLFHDFASGPVGQFFKGLSTATAPGGTVSLGTVGSAAGGIVAAGALGAPVLPAAAAAAIGYDVIKAGDKYGWPTLKEWLLGGFTDSATVGSGPSASGPVVRHPGAAGAAHGVGAPTASLIGPAGQGSTQNAFHIGSISVNTQATDAQGVAASLNAAIQRKFNVSQADSGVVA